MRQQMEDDLCLRLRERIRTAIEDHLDTCQRADINIDKAFDMAIATVIAEALTIMKADGGTPDDVVKIIQFVEQKALAL
jgi:hypothetical protein